MHTDIRRGGRKKQDLLRKQTFERLTKHLIPSMWRTAFRLTGNRDMADDLIQDTCIKAFKSFHQYEMGTNYRAWIFKILRNLWRDNIRKEARAPFKCWDDDEVNRANAHNRCEPEQECQSEEVYTKTLEAISRLSPPVRLVVCFSLLDGLSYQEIADIANIPIGTVRSRLSRGRSQLQDELRTHYFNDDLKETVTFNVPEAPSEKKVIENDANDCSRKELLT